MTRYARRSTQAGPRVRPTLTLAALLAWACAPSGANAFSGVEDFVKGAGAGGGGGRFFTGSPVDGYACGVCHQGGVAPKVRIAGLPVDGYVPGQTYEVDVSWDNPAVPKALHLEIIGRDGRAAGNLALPEEAAIDALARCGSMPGQRSAAYEQLPPGRKVLGVEACGASHLRFRFTPPDVPDVAFALSMVSSDKMATPEGDGVFSVHRVLRRFGEPKRTGDCAVARPLTTNATGSAALVALLVGWLWRRRTRRSARP